MRRASFQRAVYVLRREGAKQFASKALSAFGSTILADSPSEANLVFQGLTSIQIAGTMIDVGAATGTALAPFADGGWYVHAFEPDHRNRSKMERIFAGWPRVKIDPRAISDVDQSSVPFFTSSESIGVSSLAPFLGSHVQTDTVETISLRRYIDDFNIWDIEFLKVDTEGSDLNVLSGFPWENCRPSAVMCEFDDFKTNRLGHTWRDMGNLLIEQEYRIIVSEWKPLKRYGDRVHWLGYKTYPCELSDPAAWGNLIATNSNELFETMLELFRKFTERRERRMSVLKPMVSLFSRTHL